MEGVQKASCLLRAPKGRPMAGEIYADADDFPYLAAWRELDAQAIYTTDPHLEKMGAAVISVLIDTRLRDYARSSAVQMAVGFGSSASIMVGVQSLQGLYLLVTKLLASFRRLPPAAQLAIVCGATVCVLHPKSRAKMKEMGIVEKLPGDTGRLRCYFGIRHAIREGRRDREREL
jgi:hypothetical protein